LAVTVKLLDVGPGAVSPPVESTTEYSYAYVPVRAVPELSDTVVGADVGAPGPAEVRSSRLPPRPETVDVVAERYSVE
jgi:hypothetical protein